MRSLPLLLSCYARPMRVTITGATGLLGSNLAFLLAERGHSVRCIRRATSQVSHLDGVPIQWVAADLGEPESLVRAFEDADAVFHCAAEIEVVAAVTPRMQAVNVEGTRHVLDAVRTCGVKRLIHCSSTTAIGISTDGRPIDETHPWNLADFGLDDGYATTKRQSQEMVLAAAAEDVDAVVVCPAFMFGPFDSRPSSGLMILSVVRGQVPGYTPGLNNFVDVRDVARGMIAAWEKGGRGEVYILGCENMGYREIMELIAREALVSPPRFSMPRALATVAGWLGDLQELLSGKEALINSMRVRWGYCEGYVVSSDKARRELGYAPGPVDVAVRDALTWFRVHDML